MCVGSTCWYQNSELKTGIWSFNFNGDFSSRCGYFSDNIIERSNYCEKLAKSVAYPLSIQTDDVFEERTIVQHNNLVHDGWIPFGD